jgi:hypothetical protein
VAPRGPLGRPLDSGVGEQGPGTHPAQHPQAGAGDERRRGEEQEQIGALEEQRLADDDRAGHAAPRQHDAEQEPNGEAGKPRPHETTA